MTGSKAYSLERYREIMGDTHKMMEDIRRELIAAQQFTDAHRDSSAIWSYHTTSLHSS